MIVSVMMVRVTRGDQAPAPASDTRMESGRARRVESGAHPGSVVSGSPAHAPPRLGSEDVINVLSSDQIFCEYPSKLSSCTNYAVKYSELSEVF